MDEMRRRMKRFVGSKPLSCPTKQLNKFLLAALVSLANWIGGWIYAMVHLAWRKLLQIIFVLIPRTY